jgi:hypothetical protein
MMNDSTANDDTNKVSMLAYVTGVSEEQARQALEESGMDLNAAAMAILNDERRVNQEEHSDSAKKNTLDSKKAPLLPKVPESKTAARHKEVIDKKSTAQPGTGSQEPSKISSKIGPRRKTPNAAASIAASRTTASRPRHRTSTTTRPAPSLSMSSVTEIPKETSSTRRDRPPSVSPGAEAVDGPGASCYENDEYTLTTQTTTFDNLATMDRIITATLVENNEDDLEGVHEQLRNYEQQLERMRRERENVAIAEVVPNDIESPPHEFYHGQDTSDNPKPCSSSMNSGRKKWILAIVVIAIIIVGIVVGVVVASSNGQPIQQAQSPPPTAPQDTGQVALQDLAELLSSISLDGGTALQTPSTPQYNALNWLAGNANLDGYSNQRKIQRYVLATLYYSTNGDAWVNNAGWLGDDNECEWWNEAYGPFCVDSAVVELDLHSNNLVGTIPVELALLSTSVGKFVLLLTFILVIFKPVGPIVVSSLCSFAFLLDRKIISA